jgi:rhodanese-related sulfurtransferase
MRALASTIGETLLVALLGLICALAANAVSPRGLSLARDYFPTGERSSAPVGRAPAPANASTAAAGTSAVEDPVVRRLARQQLRAVSGSDAVALFQDPQREHGLFVFIDARDDVHYQAGHIPGAWQFNHYRPESFLPTVLPVCLSALKVVVYCTGGQCEDSEFAAIMLRDMGVPAENILVYIGGMSDWAAGHHPIEIGGRSSGQFLKP